MNDHILMYFFTKVRAVCVLIRGSQTMSAKKNWLDHIFFIVLQEILTTAKQVSAAAPARNLSTSMTREPMTSSKMRP